MVSLKMVDHYYGSLEVMDWYLLRFIVADDLVNAQVNLMIQVSYKYLSLELRFSQLGPEWSYFVSSVYLMIRIS